MDETDVTQMLCFGEVFFGNDAVYFCLHAWGAEKKGWFELSDEDGHQI